MIYIEVQNIPGSFTSCSGVVSFSKAITGSSHICTSASSCRRAIPEGPGTGSSEN